MVQFTPYSHWPEIGGVNGDWNLLDMSYAHLHVIGIYQISSYLNDNFWIVVWKQVSSVIKK